jgi:DNA-binding PadR family transcriptional regulator
MTPVFGHGDFRLYLLDLLARRPRHGYELIRALEDEMGGTYAPSPGAVYPRLASMESEGLIEHEDVETRKVYRITDAGRAELKARREELDEVRDRIVDAAGLAREIREEVGSSVRELRRELLEATRELRGEGRRRRASARDPRSRKITIEVGGVAAGDTAELSREARALQEDVESLVADVMKAAQQHGVDREGMAAIRRILREARERAVAELAGSSGAER